MKKTWLAAIAAVFACAFAPATVRAQKALVYCPPSEAGCTTIISAIASQFPNGVDKGYDGQNGTVDLAKGDLQHYSVLVVPSLADKYDVLLRAAPHIKMSTRGRVAVWSGT